MINLSKLIKESMSLYVKGANYHRLDNLMDLSFHLTRKIDAILEKLPEDQIQYFYKNRPMELLTVDGSSDMDSATGVLNLYYSGYTSSTLKKILSAIISECKNLNIKLGKIRMEDSRAYKYKVVRIPVMENKNEYAGAPIVNMTNRNAYHIFSNVLQFEYDDGFSFTATELKDRIISILKHDPSWIEKNKIETSDSEVEVDPESTSNADFQNPFDADKSYFSGAKIIDFGLDGEQIKERLMSLLNVAEWAIKNNKQELYVA